MATKEESKPLLLLTGTIDPSYQKALDLASKMSEKMNAKVEKETRAAGKSFGRFVSTFKGMAKSVGASSKSMMTLAVKGIGEGSKSIMEFAGKRIGANGKSISDFIGKSIELASSMNEVQRAVDNTFKGNSSEIDAWAKNALKSYGLSELSAKKYASTLGATFKSSGVASKDVLAMSENLIGLTGDFASFYNLSSDEAFNKILSGISGDSDALKDLGINMSAANIEAYALSKGIQTSYDKMDEASQTMLRHDYLLSATRDAQGSFSKTSGSFANQQRLLTEQFTQTAASLGQNFIPVISMLMAKANEFLQSDAMSKAMDLVKNAVEGAIVVIEKAYGIGRNIVDFVVAHSDLFVPLAIGIGGFITALLAWNVVTGIATGVTNAFYLAVGLLRSKFTIALIIISAIIAVGYLLIKNWSAISAFFVDLWQNRILPVLKVVAIAIKFIIAVITAWYAATLVLPIAINAVSMAIGFLTSPIGLVVLAIGAIIAIGYLLIKNWSAISAFFVDLWQNKVMPVFSAVGEFISGVWNGVTEGFKAFINFFIQGLNIIIRGMNTIQFDVPSWVPFIGGQRWGFNIPEIPLLATGGRVIEAGTALVGEKGPELVNLPRGAEVYSNDVYRNGTDFGSVQLVFSPTYNIYGGEAEVRKAALDAQDEFERRLETYFGNRRRVSFNAGVLSI